MIFVSLFLVTSFMWHVNILCTKKLNGCVYLIDGHGGVGYRVEPTASHFVRWEFGTSGQQVQ